MGLHKYTQEEFNTLPVNQFGIKPCPTGDYSAIKIFYVGCSFGERCSFNERCSFGKRCSFEGGKLTNVKFVNIGGIGSRGDTTYFFIDDKKEIWVRCGCFFGDTAAFEKAVNERHYDVDNLKYKIQYTAAIEFIKKIAEI